MGLNKDDWRNGWTDQEIMNAGFWDTVICDSLSISLHYLDNANHGILTFQNINFNLRYTDAYKQFNPHFSATKCLR